MPGEDASNWLKSFLEQSWFKIKRLIPIGKGWQQVFGFTVTPPLNNTCARSLTTFQGWLYMGTENPSALEIWRTWDGLDWEQVVGPKAKVPAGFGKVGNYAVNGMVELGGKLFVGTHLGVWCTPDGLNWNQAMGCPEACIEALTAFDGWLYVTSGIKIKDLPGGPEIWRGKEQGAWETVVGDEPPAKIASGFGDAGITDITSLAVYNGWLYAGAGKDNPFGPSGISVWRTQDGVNWQNFQDQVGSLHIHGMGVYQGSLYVGGYHALTLFCTNGNAGNWQDVRDGIDVGNNDGVKRFGNHEGKLYLGALGLGEDGFLWETGDGLNWSCVDTKEIKRNTCDAIHSFKNHLYITTRGIYTFAGSQQNKLEVWRYGERWLVEDWLLNFRKPFLRLMPIFHFPPPPIEVGDIDEKVEPKTKKELLIKIHLSRRYLEEILSKLRSDAMVQPMTPGGWSVKDTLAHLVAWEKNMGYYLETALRGEVPSPSSPHLSDEEINQLNNQIYHQNVDRTLDEVLEDFRLSYLRVNRLVETASEEALWDTSRFPWREGVPLWVKVAANTWWHYKEHGKVIQEWANDRIS